jgi:hypothetical protein
MPSWETGDPVALVVRTQGARSVRELTSFPPGFASIFPAAPHRDVLKLYQVDAADVVVAIGGADKTLQAAIAAAASGKRVVPVGCFGGAAFKAASLFQQVRETWGPHIPTAKVLGQLMGSWSPSVMTLVLNALGVRYPRLMIVHGADHTSRDNLAALLESLGLPPLIMELQPDAGQPLPDKFEQVAMQADAAIVLMTPDDVGGRRGESRSEQQLRARQNVWLEFGWFWARKGRDRVLPLRREGELELPSDVIGRMVYRFKSSPQECEDVICDWIETMGWPRPRRSTGEDDARR